MLIWNYRKDFAVSDFSPLTPMLRSFLFVLLLQWVQCLRRVRSPKVWGRCLRMPGKGASGRKSCIAGEEVSDLRLMQAVSTCLGGAFEAWRKPFLVGVSPPLEVALWLGIHPHSGLESFTVLFVQFLHHSIMHSLIPSSRSGRMRVTRENGRSHGSKTQGQGGFPMNGGKKTPSAYTPVCLLPANQALLEQLHHV